MIQEPPTHCPCLPHLRLWHCEPQQASRARRCLLLLLLLLSGQRLVHQLQAGRPAGVVGAC